MDSLVLGADKALMFPAGNGTDRPLVFDLTGIFKAEGRLVELQAVTKAKAGELTYTFIVAWRDASDYWKRARAQLIRAKRALKEVRARVILDRSSSILKEKGLASSRSPAGSEGLRESVVSLDPEYQAVSDRVEQVEAASDFLETKVELFKMAYFSVDKLVDPSDRAHRDVSGGAGSDEPGVLTREERLEEFVREKAVVNPSHYRGGFGAPVY
jgi:hypothetical protein